MRFRRRRRATESAAPDASPHSPGVAPDVLTVLRVLIVTDAWRPQVNGVVRTLEMLIAELQAEGHEIRLVTPDGFLTFPLPTYPEIKLALLPGRRIARAIREFQPHAIHVSTEGTLGLSARNLCVRRRIPFTTSFHTKFPEYIRARFGVPESWTYRVLHWFHAPAEAVMVATPTLECELAAHGFRNLQIWSRGVDTHVFRPGPKDWLNLPRPVWLYVGRIAVEKNIEAFLALDLPGTKLVVGDGPQRAELAAKYPKTVFAGPKFGDELVRHYQASDVFVFPSKTDTFGLVLLEAMACGLPVAAYPVQGPIDVIGRSLAGALDDDLGKACRIAAAIDPERAREHALRFSWRACARQFLKNLAVPGFEAVDAAETDGEAVRGAR